MQGQAAMPKTIAEGAGAPIRVLLFFGTFLFFWISLDPFVDLTGELSVAQSSGLNQIVLPPLFLALLGFGVLHPMRSIIMRPRFLLGAINIWFLAVCLLSDYPLAGMKAVVLAVMVTVCACTFLLLPTTERQFAKMIGLGVLIVLAVAYFGVVFKPLLAIHQASEAREPMLAGLWRGHFLHKNSAANAMVIAAFLGIFVMSSWSRLVGAAIIVLSVVFLVQTGGKTATAMLPAILLAGWVFEKVRFLRIPIVIGGIVLTNLFTVGSVVFAPIGEFVNNLGIDATFTNRSDVWRVAFSAIEEHPLTGTGFRAFWQTSELVYGGGLLESWAVVAAHAHNSYLDIALAAGIPGLVLTVIWIVIVPLYDLSRVDQTQSYSPLTRLFVRIWLYGIFIACLETLFFQGKDLFWFMFVFSLYGLYLQSSATLMVRVKPAGSAAVSQVQSA